MAKLISRGSLHEDETNLLGYLQRNTYTSFPVIHPEPATSLSQEVVSSIQRLEGKLAFLMTEVRGTSIGAVSFGTHTGADDQHSQPGRNTTDDLVGTGREIVIFVNPKLDHISSILVTRVPATCDELKEIINLDDISSDDDDEHLQFPVSEPTHVKVEEVSSEDNESGMESYSSDSPLLMSLYESPPPSFDIPSPHRSPLPHTPSPKPWESPSVLTRTPSPVTNFSLSLIAVRCTRCLDKLALGVRQSDPNVVKEHLILRGFMKDYTCWIRHGDDFDECNYTVDHDFVDNNENYESNNTTCDNLHEMLQDVEDDIADKHYEKFEQLSVDSEKPLYVGCEKFTKLPVVLRLFNLKANNNWSDKSFTSLLEILHEMLPEDNELPISLY
ncbi:hypothetical protein OSB04_000953 [Centaurea solstitialis]|uniref:Transposase-associated domain-containing protein n=1 Tax=Centaurea solstitialis TaxID=347529 RepID=A0AA38U8E9_9ASTR|nr:hypothetical protein OSB04_000953 [Centaurea solstitialis]